MFAGDCINQGLHWASIRQPMHDVLSQLLQSQLSGTAAGSKLSLIITQDLAPRYYGPDTALKEAWLYLGLLLCCSCWCRRFWLCHAQVEHLQSSFEQLKVIPVFLQH